MWNMGKTQETMSWLSFVVIGIRSSINLSWCMFETIFLCVNTTPFGNPVVPLEYGKTAISSGEG